MPGRGDRGAPRRQGAARRWPAERFAAVARALAGDGHQVVITGSAVERALAAPGRPAGWPAATAAVFAGRTDLGQLAALVAHARLVVSGDTGIAASRHRVPGAVGGAVRTGAAVGGARRRTGRGTGRSGAGPSRPHVDAIPVEEVLAAVGSVSRAGVTRARRPETSDPVRVSDAVAAQ